MTGETIIILRPETFSKSVDPIGIYWVIKTENAVKKARIMAVIPKNVTGLSHHSLSGILVKKRIGCKSNFIKS